MTDEERKAISWLSALEIKSEYEATNKEIVLNLINKQEKAIDRMAEVINASYRNAELINTLIEKRICTKLIEPEKEESDCYFDVYKKDACKECIKEYFMEDKE